MVAAAATTGRLDNEARLVNEEQGEICQMERGSQKKKKISKGRTLCKTSRNKR